MTPEAFAEASSACNWCRRRKKKCSRTLPQCSYCQGRELECSYTLESPAPVACAEPLAKPPSRSDHDGQRLINQQARQIRLQLESQSRLSVEELVRPFWSGLHLWLPALAPELFNSRLADYSGTGPPDFGILTLAIILVATEPSGTAPFDTDVLYLAVKTLLSQLLSYGVNSMDAVKAALLIAIYEYATQRSSAAFITITSAIRVAYAAGLDEEPSADQLTGPEQHEMNALWWALVICERLFVLETRNPHQPLLLPFPAATRPLPWVELGLTYNGLEVATPGTVKSAQRSGLVRAVQATAMLDEVIAATRPLRHSDPLQSNVAVIDTELRSFLSLLLEECAGTWAIFCGAIAIVIRATFALHAPSHTVQDHPSGLVFESAMRMMIDIAESHVTLANAGDVAALPPTCIYILQASLDHLDRSGRDSSIYDSRDSRSVQVLKTFLADFTGRWVGPSLKST